MSVSAGFGVQDSMLGGSTVYHSLVPRPLLLTDVWAVPGLELHKIKLYFVFTSLMFRPRIARSQGGQVFHCPGNGKIVFQSCCVSSTVCKFRMVHILSSTHITSVCTPVSGPQSSDTAVVSDRSGVGQCLDRLPLCTFRLGVSPSSFSSEIPLSC